MRQKLRAFDRQYFDRWYRGRKPVATRDSVRRQAAVAVAAAEFLLERPIRRVLDIGAGEGAWRRELKALRPNAWYLGLDTSAYAVRRFGKRRNIRHGSWGELGAVKGLGRFDLVVCADVLHYVDAAEVRRGARTLGRALTGVAYLHAFTCDDDVEGDTAGHMDRAPQFYRRVFRSAGLTEAGLGIWAARDLAGQLASLEAPGRR